MPAKYYYSEANKHFICYEGDVEITNDDEMEAFMASSFYFGLGETKESAQEILEMNKLELKKITWH